MNKEKIVFILIIILAIIIGNNLIFKPNIGKIGSLREQIEKEENKNELFNLIDASNRRLNIYQQRSFPSEESTQLVDKISQLSASVGVVVESFKPQAPLYTEQYTELPLIVLLHCDYHRLGKLLSLIENSQEFIRVRRIRMQKKLLSQTAEQELPEVELVLSGLYLQE